MGEFMLPVENDTGHDKIEDIIKPMTFIYLF